MNELAHIVLYIFLSCVLLAFAAWIGMMLLGLVSYILYSIGAGVMRVARFLVRKFPAP
jgi:hypothetical protein